MYVFFCVYVILQLTLKKKKKASASLSKLNEGSGEKQENTYYVPYISGFCHSLLRVQGEGIIVLFADEKSEVQRGKGAAQRHRAHLGLSRGSDPGLSASTALSLDCMKGHLSLPLLPRTALPSLRTRNRRPRPLPRHSAPCSRR